MPHFTKLLHTKEGNVIFYFNRIYTVEGTRYHVSVMDTTRHSFAFNMQENRGTWKMVNTGSCPEWIIKLEPEISNAIIEHIAESRKE